MTIVISVIPDYQNILLIRKSILFTVIAQKKGWPFLKLRWSIKKKVHKCYQICFVIIHELYIDHFFGLV